MHTHIGPQWMPVGQHCMFVCLCVCVWLNTILSVRWICHTNSVNFNIRHDTPLAQLHNSNLPAAMAFISIYAWAVQRRLNGNCSPSPSMPVTHKRCSARWQCKQTSFLRDLLDLLLSIRVCVCVSVLFLILARFVRISFSPISTLFWFGTRQTVHDMVL